MQVQVIGLRGVACHGTGNALAFTGNHRHRYALLGDIFGQLIGLEVTVPRVVHLVALGQVQPELKAFHHAFFLLRNLGVDHAFGGRHPLHAAVFQQALVAGAVTVQHAPGNHVGDGLKAAVRVVGKAGDVVVGLVAAKRIEHQKGVQPVLQVLGQHAGEFDARAVRGSLAGHQPLNGA